MLRINKSIVTIKKTKKPQKKQTKRLLSLETKDPKRSIRSLSINLRLLQFANTLVFLLLCC
jgi:hypothetical protein